MEFNIAEISRGFMLEGEFVNADRYGTGHINDTFKMSTTCQTYILQRINTAIFREPEKLMDNFVRVSRHIESKIAAEKAVNPATRRRFLQVILSHKGEPFFIDADGNFWRCYIFVDEARTYDVLEKSSQAYAAAKAFGAFQNDLADLPGRLNETIANFHNTPSRLANLEAAVKEDKCGRLKDVAPELDYIMARKDEYSLLLNELAAGNIFERTTHNDTKLNNVLIDDVSGEGICVIDLDTVMPGLPHYDFGDMVRTGTSPAPEDELDLSKVGMRFEMFEALLRGFLSSAGNFLNAREKELLPFSGKLITLEIGMRFLTDYLSGDVYFKIHREKHNLDRCRTQVKLAQSIEEQFDAMRKLNDSITL
ncbi:MAG: aminoglycoside phosphotransferase family protein [Lentisphaeria bacterium]|nr:aminoglycoside phosphotransferase family protein [Lentisphaeria bacterium]